MTSAQSHAAGSEVTVEVADGVATVRLDRPPMNALSRSVQESLREAAVDLGTRPDVRAVVLYGGPKVFAAGADIKEMAGMTAADMAFAATRLQECFREVARHPQAGRGRGHGVRARRRPGARAVRGPADPW